MQFAIIMLSNKVRRNGMIDRKVFTLRTSEELINKIAEIANINKRSMNAQVEYFLEQCVKNYEKDYPLISSQEKIKID